jgi:hypothetical protein
MPESSRAKPRVAKRKSKNWTPAFAGVTREDKRALANILSPSSLPGLTRQSIPLALPIAQP